MEHEPIKGMVWYVWGVNYEVVRGADDPFLYLGRYCHQTQVLADEEEEAGDGDVHGQSQA